MNSNAKKASVVNRVVPPLTLWVLNKLLTQRRVMDVSQRLDQRARRQKRRAKRVVRDATRNARSNSGWLAAGMAAVGLGVTLIARATRPK